MSGRHYRDWMSGKKKMEDGKTKLKMQKQELYNNLPAQLKRETPYIITEFHLPENEQMLESITLQLDFHITSNNFIQPYSLYDTLKKGPKYTHIIKEDFLLTQNKEYLDILEGAIRTTDSGMPWKVSYYHYEPFLFEGKIILCTALTENKIKRRKKLKFLADCCYFI